MRAQRGFGSERVVLVHSCFGPSDLLGMRKSSKVAPGESQAHGEDELRSQKRIEELEREKAELLATVDTQREEIA